MSMSSGASGAVMSYVTRQISKGKIKTETAFRNDENELQKKEVAMTDPVVIFFPSKSCVVMEKKIAREKGFLEPPEIMNLETVQDQRSLAGRYKFAMTPEARMDAWQKMEDEIINAIISMRGNPLPEGCAYSKETIFAVAKPKVEEAA